MCCPLCQCDVRHGTEYLNRIEADGSGMGPRDAGIVKRLINIPGRDRSIAHVELRFSIEQLVLPAPGNGVADLAGLGNSCGKGCERKPVAIAGAAIAGCRVEALNAHC